MHSSLFAVLFLCWAIPLARHCGVAAAATDENNAFGVAGYLPDYRFYIDLNQTALFLDDLYLFSIQLNTIHGSDMLKGCCLGPEQFQKAHKAASYKMEVQGRELTRWLTIGGGGRSDGFQALDNKEKYKSFIKGVRKLVKEYGIGGIDFDHEALHTRDDAIKYFRMIVAVAPSLREMGLSVSMAVHVGFTIPAQVHEVVDRINVMTYDMPFAGMSEVTSAIKNFVQDGVPAQKLFMGIPAYGRHSQDPGRVMTFAEMVDAAGTHFLDRKKGPWTAFRYDGPDTVRQKVKWAKQKKLGGVFIWELGHDKQLNAFPGGVLLKAAKDEASKRSPPSSDEL